MQKNTDGSARSTEPATSLRTRRTTAARLNARSIALARAAQAWFNGLSATPAGTVRNAAAAWLRTLATAERALPIAVAALVAVASLLAVLPTAPVGATGGTAGTGQSVRIAVGGGLNRSAPIDATGMDALGTTDSGGNVDESFVPVVLPGGDVGDPTATNDGTDATTDPAADPSGASDLLDDGTLVTGYNPATDVADGADLIVTYKVKSGDTLSGIARKFGVGMMTLWWANKLESKDSLHVGQVLRIPPVNGLVVTVKDGDTLEALADKHGSTVDRIMTINQLEDTTLVVGQVLILPGAKGAPMPTPKPTPKPKYTHSGGGSSSGSHYGGSGPTNYGGGSFHWPVIGGGNYVSQYFHYGHGAIDIAADYGSAVVAAAGGRVTFAGWKSNGGGWQVWISHGDGIYTTYNHMSALTVGTGQYVRRGQQVGRIGATGWATGPHLHFEVWRGGEPWAGGYQTNPMRWF